MQPTISSPGQLHDPLQLAQSKRRDKKVAITDIAIEKIPLVRYPGIPREQCEILREIAKSVLVISRDENDSNGVAITYSLESERLKDEGLPYFGIAFGDEHMVDPASSTDAFHLLNSSGRDLVVTIHNHPSLTTLSLPDIGFLLEYASVRMIVAVTNLGAIFYLLKTDKFDRPSSIRLLQRSVELTNDAQTVAELNEASKVFLADCSNVGLRFGHR